MGQFVPIHTKFGGQVEESNLEFVVSRTLEWGEGGFYHITNFPNWFSLYKQFFVHDSPWFDAWVLCCLYR